jgi:hypothetical protein
MNFKVSYKILERHSSKKENISPIPLINLIHTTACDYILEGDEEQDSITQFVDFVVEHV